MAKIVESEWRSFIKLTLFKKDSEGFNGYTYVDPNMRLNLVRNEEDNYTLVLLGADGKTAVAVTETPEEIITEAEAGIKAQAEKAKADFEALKQQYEGESKEG